jgi:hypothetical protein
MTGSSHTQRVQLRLLVTLRSLVALALLVGCSGQRPMGPCDGGTCPPPPPPPATWCDAGAVLDAIGTCTAIGWSDCPAGFSADPTGWACAPVVPAARCPAGAMPRLGKSDCAPVGWLSCDAGFVADDAGWGCEAVLAPLARDGGSACSGATREALGRAGCAPVGDCSDAGFPPAGATVFVDDSYAVVDATHFRTIAAAMNAAPPGATIAIESGSYREALVPNRPLNLVGRCPATVRLTTDGGSAALSVLGPVDVGIARMTISGALLAVRAENGARVTGRSLVLEGNRRSAIRVTDPATHLTLDDSVVRATQPDPGTGILGEGITATLGAQLTLDDVALVGNRENGMVLDGAATHLDGTRVVIQSTRPRTTSDRLGAGLTVQHGSTADLREVALVDNQGAGLLVTESGSRATVNGFVIHGTRPGLDELGADLSAGAAARGGGHVELGAGAVLASTFRALDADGAGSRVTLSGAVIRGVTSPVPNASAVSVTGAASVGLDHVVVTEIASTGIWAATGGTATLDDVLVSQPPAEGLRSEARGAIIARHVTVDRAVAAAALVCDPGSTVALTDSLLLESRWAAQAVDGGSASLERCVLDGDAAAALHASGGAIAATAVTVRDGGEGAVAERGGTVSLTQVLLERSASAGLRVTDPSSHLDADRCVVRDTLPDGTGDRGRGASALSGGSLGLKRTALLGNRQAGIYASGSKVVLDDVLVRGTLAQADGGQGHALVVVSGGDAAMTRGSLDSSAGIGAVFSASSGLLDAVRVSSNAAGVYAQGGSTRVELETAPAMRGPTDVVLLSSTKLTGNGANPDAGEVALPAP